jgi:acetoacetyl-CoA synthetase
MMDKLLWEPSEARASATSMRRFLNFVNDRRSLGLRDYSELYRWSVDSIPDFWADAWAFLGIKASRCYERVVDDPRKMPGAKWFEGARLNFAENLLRYRDDRVAIVFKGESSPSVSSMTYAELYDEVARLAASLRDVGIVPGDRVAGFMPNMPQTIVAMLAATSLGAVWSSCSPDFGIKGVLDRIGQTKPRVLFAADGYFYKGKPIDSLARVDEIISELPSIERIVVVPYVKASPDISSLGKAVLYAKFVHGGPAPRLEFAQLPFDHPLYIMFTSGTTGLPKCMVQGAGGILLNQMKELVLHTGLSCDDTIFYFTTCGWMMWNWLVCSLAVGARIVLFDGNPFYPDSGALWRLAVEQGVTVFGTSAGYLSALQAEGAKPGRDFDLSRVRAILSTGSPLSEESFEYVYRDIKADVQLSSISGGSDINGCFALGNPMGPVYSGELQCRGLGMRVESFDDSGSSVVGFQGELVCTAAAPCMPVYFWNDPDGSRYRAAYFDVYPGVWRHGDFVRISERGGVTIYGRSDATLNPGGVRIGTAEIYRQVETIEGIADSLVVGQDWKNDVRVILFVKMAEGAGLDDALRDRIRKVIRENASPRHVPAKIIEAPDIPYTLNMKKVELAVKKTIEGLPVDNKDALKNPEALVFFASLPELARE